MAIACSHAQTPPADVSHFAITMPKGVLSYWQRQGEGDATVVFIHGTPGSANAFAEFLSEPWLTGRFGRIISVDRPGWGASVQAGEQVLSLAQQSQMLGALFSHLQSSAGDTHNIIVVGHSLGGSLVARLLSDYPQTLDAGLILAGTVDPKLAKPRWYHHAAKWWPVRKAIGSSLVQSNREMLLLPTDVAAASEYYNTINQPITVIQGGKDKLVSKYNAHYADAMWPQATVVNLPQSGHFLPWQQQHLIVSHIHQLLDTLYSQHMDTNSKY